MIIEHLIIFYVISHKREIREKNNYFILSWIEFFSFIIYQSLFKIDLESSYSNLLIEHHRRLKIEEQG
jgi:hypothetical protein